MYLWEPALTQKYLLQTQCKDLEDYQGCFYEDGAEACQKEIDVSTIHLIIAPSHFLTILIATAHFSLHSFDILSQDRHDLSNVLLLQGEMQERTRYLKEGNLFAYDVKADQDMHERDEFIEHVVPELDL